MVLLSDTRMEPSGPQGAMANYPTKFSAHTPYVHIREDASCISDIFLDLSL